MLRGSIQIQALYGANAPKYTIIGKVMLRLVSIILALVLTQSAALAQSQDEWTGRLVACYSDASGITQLEFRSMLGSLTDATLERFSRSKGCALLRVKIPGFENTEYKIYQLDPQPARKVATDIMREMQSRYGVPYGAIPLSADRVMKTSTVTPNDYFFPQQWGLNKISAPSAWEQTTGSADVIVAVLDTGVDYGHDELRGSMWGNQGEWQHPHDNIDNDGDGYIDNLYGINAAQNSGDPADISGHGTMVSGIITARTNDGYGIAGLNWDLDLMAVNVAQLMNGEAKVTSFAAIQGIDWVIRRKLEFGDNVRVINASWGSPGQDEGIRLAIQRARDAGIVFVAAAGNSAAGNDNDVAPRYPANYSELLSNIISVAATDQSDNLASFSHYGANSVQIAAPGEDIITAYPNNQYAITSGTSMAAPFVSGALALLFARHPEFSVIQAKAALLSSVDISSGLVGKVKSGGRLNVDTMLNIAESIAAQVQVLEQTREQVDGLIQQVATLKKKLLVPHNLKSSKKQKSEAKKWVGNFGNALMPIKLGISSSSLILAASSELEGKISNIQNLLKLAKGKKATKTQIKAYATSIKSELSLILQALI